VVRGRADLVLPPGEDGTGAGALVRPEGGDLFGWGAREAVVRALAGAVEDRQPFGAPVDRDELDAALARLPDATDRTAVAAVCFAHGWEVDGWDGGGAGARTDVVCRVSPVTT
jgi:coenzyme F420-0:L-glutamate ligase/coenzyme F420-1:gamma-L-glutamate ligase